MNETKVNTNIGDVSSPKVKKASVLGERPQPCHQRYTGYLPEFWNNQDAVFASAVADVTRGTRVITSMLRDHLNDMSALAGGAGASVRPLLCDSDAEALAALAEFSLDQLYAWAEGRVDGLNAQVAAGVQA